MPKIDRNTIESVFFLYRTRDDAVEGNDAQGTGFLVRCDRHYYGVSNWHVVADAAAPVIRLSRDSGVEIIDLDSSDWHWDCNIGDIAVVALALPAKTIYERPWSAINLHAGLAKNRPECHVGDEVFMIGMFANHQGQKRNNPLARFGNVSMVASKDSPIPHPRYRRPGGSSCQYEAHIVDMHSRSGFSGAPVFTYRPYGTKVLLDTGERVVDLRGAGMSLLGIHYAQFSEPFELRDAELVTVEAVRQMVGPNTTIMGNSGMTCVAPVWKIAELLYSEKFADQRYDDISSQ